MALSMMLAGLAEIAQPWLTAVCFPGISARRGDRSSWTRRQDSGLPSPRWHPARRAPGRCAAAGRRRDSGGCSRWMCGARERGARPPRRPSGAAPPPRPTRCPRSPPCPAAPSAPSARRRSSPLPPASPTTTPAPSVTARSATSAASTPTRISPR